MAKVSFTDGSIVGVNGGKIGPANTIRFSPWGQDSSTPDVANNTQIISVNKSVRGQLANTHLAQELLPCGNNVDEWRDSGCGQTLHYRRLAAVGQFHYGNVFKQDKLFLMPRQ